MLSVQNIKKNFDTTVAVNDVSFEIRQGEVVGFLGPNGAGKSTTMRILTGFLNADSGTVCIDGMDISQNPVKAKKMIGYLPESAALYQDMEVTDFLGFMGKMRGLCGANLKERLRTVIRQCQLSSVLGKRIHTLSKGYRQRVGLAQALIHDPQILVLDEPTVGLDPNQITEIRELIRDIGRTKTILLSTHILPEVSATCGRVIIINAGKIVAEGTPETLSQNQIKKSLYHVAIRGDVELITARLKDLPGFVSSHIKQGQNNLHQVTLETQVSEDLSETIFDLAVQNQWRLSKLTREHMSLEDVFRDLTREPLPSPPLTLRGGG